MISATIDVVGEKGYAELTVSDVIKRAGVSRRAFYEHFSNREECFLAAYDSIMADSAAAVGGAFGSGENLPVDAQGAIETIFQRALRRPDAVRVLLVEIGTAGPAGITRREQVGASYEALLRERLGLPRGEGPIANPVLRGVIGGIAAVLYSHMQSGKRKQLLELVPQLVRWTTSYLPAPPELMNFRDASPDTLPRNRVGGRAPGTLSLGAASSKRRRLVGGEHSVSPIYVAHSQRLRILDAVANLTAANGYAALTVEGIAAEAAISLQAFYEHFPSKEDAFLVAYEIGHDKGLALVERAFDSHEDWRIGVRAGIQALFDYLASEPAFAHLALVDVQAASSRVTERAARGVTSYTEMLAPGFSETPREQRPPHVTSAAIAGGLFELCLHHALQRRMDELPLLVPRATYFALAPFIGADAAGKVAIDGKL
ncbi:MAG TPA: TetR/AcrR family transcriptional regulator [Solirubrobacteraceae bacterium]|jgi:AcrR family transcriptional regulator